MRENYDVFLDSLNAILSMDEGRHYFIKIFQKSVWQLSNTETKEFDILSDLAYFFHVQNESGNENDLQDKVKATIFNLELLK